MLSREKGVRLKRLAAALVMSLLLLSTIPAQAFAQAQNDDEASPVVFVIEGVLPELFAEEFCEALRDLGLVCEVLQPCPDPAFPATAFGFCRVIFEPHLGVDL